MARSAPRCWPANRCCWFAEVVPEQGITAHNVRAIGAALVLEPGQESHAGALITRLLMEPGFARAALEFRFRHQAPSQAQIVEAVAQRWIELSA